MVVKDFAVDNDVYILALTETWLRPGNIDDIDVGTPCPTGYRFLHVPRSTAEEEELVSYSKTVLMLTPQSQIPLKRLNSWMFVSEIVRALEF